MNKNTNSLISIIIPVYKVEKYLDRCIESLINQAYKNLEIILVDDGSPDNCPQMCDEWAKKDNRIKVIHKPNGGVSTARNVGIEVANGDYISFVDSDDYVDKRFIELLYNSNEQNGSDIAISRYKKIINDKIVYDNEGLNDFVVTNDLRMLVCDREKVNAYLCRCLFKKELLKSNKFDENLTFCEDLHLFLRILENKPKMSFVDEYLYNYVIHDQSMCNRINDKFIRLFEKGALACEEQFLKMGYEIESKSILYNIYLLAIKQGSLLKDKNTILEFKNKYNTRENYIAFSKCNKTFKSKIKAYIARHNWIAIYGLLLKLS